MDGNTSGYSSTLEKSRRFVVSFLSEEKKGVKYVQFQTT